MPLQHYRALRQLVTVYGGGLLLVNCYLGLSMLILGPSHFTSGSWTYFWQLPGEVCLWGLWPLLSAVLGIVGLFTHRRKLAMVGCLTASLWAFLAGCFMWVALITVSGTDPWWPAVMWYWSVSYTMLGMSLTDRYLLPRGGRGEQ